MVSYGWPGEARLLAERLAMDMINHQLPPLSAPIVSMAVDEQAEIPIASCSSNFRPQQFKPTNGQQRRNRKNRNVASNTQSNESDGYRKPPTRDQLTATRRAVTMLQRAIFLLKTLVRSSTAQSPLVAPQICPVTVRPTMALPTAMPEANPSALPAFYFPANSNALRLAIRTLLAARGPAPTKQLEVQIFVLEQELYTLLRYGVRPTAHDLTSIREIALDFLRRNAGGASELPRPNVPPLLFANFVWEALDTSGEGRRTTNREPHSSAQTSAAALLSDDQLAMAVALCTLRMRVSFSERQYPMLFECMRRQRNEFAFQLLTKNSGSKDKLNMILDSFLDPQVHCIYTGAATNAILNRSCSQCRNAQQQSPSFCTCWRVHEAAIIEAATHLNNAGQSEATGRRAIFERMTSTASSSNDSAQQPPASRSNKEDGRSAAEGGGSFEQGDSPCSSSNFTQNEAQSSGRAASSCVREGANESGATTEDLQSIESSRSSDCHSTKTSASTSKSSSLSGAPIFTPSSKESPTVEGCPVVEWPLQTHGRRPTASYGEVRIPPYALQYASDDLTNSLLEMAKKLVQDAGGAQPSNYMNVVDALVNDGQVAMNRPLQMCAFIIGLYALGVNNIVDHNGWTSRHYSMLVGWLCGQIIDLGPDAFRIVVETWEHHFSAGEIVTLVGNAHQSMDDRLVPFTADLLLSAMYKADRMTKQDCQKALNLCRDSTVPILQKACEIVEEVAKHDGISPETLFYVAEHWYELHATARVSEGAVDQDATGAEVGPSACVPPPCAPPPTPQQQMWMPPMNAAQSLYSTHQMQQPWEYTAFPPPPPPPFGFNPSQFNLPPPTLPPQMRGYPPMPLSGGGFNVPPHMYGPPVGGQQMPAFPPAEPQQQQHRLHASQSAPNLQPGMTAPHPSHGAPIASNCGSGGGMMPYGNWSQHSYATDRNVDILPLRNVHFAQQQMGGAAKVVYYNGGFNNGHKHPSLSTNRFFPPTASSNVAEWKLYKAYEMGMKALDKMGVPNFDETRDYVKYSSEPDFKAEILALMRTTLDLKSTYCVQNFCQTVATRMASPHVLIHVFEKVLCEHFGRHSFGPQQQHIYITRPYGKDRMGKEGGGSYIDFKRVGNHLRDILLNDLNYPFALAELGRACAETLYRATSRKMSHSVFVESDNNEARDLIRLAIRFFGFFDYPGHQLVGAQLLDIFHGIMRTQKNRRIYAEILKDIHGGGIGP